MKRNIKARDSRNRPLVSMGIAEAHWLVKYGCAVWHGRKKQEIRFYVPGEAIRAYLHLMRFAVECNPISMDCRTIKRLTRTNFDHARNAAYGAGAKALTEEPFLSEHEYCDLALETYLRDIEPPTFRRAARKDSLVCT